MTWDSILSEILARSTDRAIDERAGIGSSIVQVNAKKIRRFRGPGSNHTPTLACVQSSFWLKLGVDLARRWRLVEAPPRRCVTASPCASFLKG